MGDYRAAVDRAWRASTRRMQVWRRWRRRFPLADPWRLERGADRLIAEHDRAVAIAEERSGHLALLTGSAAGEA